MSNWTDLDEAIWLLRNCIANSHEALPTYLIQKAGDFLGKFTFPYNHLKEPPAEVKVVLTIRIESPNSPPG